MLGLTEREDLRGYLMSHTRPDGATPPGKVSYDQLMESKNPSEIVASRIREIVGKFVLDYWRKDYFPSTCYDIVLSCERPWQSDDWATIKPYDRLGYHVSGIHRDGRIVEGDGVLESNGEYCFEHFYKASDEVIIGRSLYLLETGMDLLKKRAGGEKSIAEALPRIKDGYRVTRGRIQGVLGILEGTETTSQQNATPAA